MKHIDIFCLDLLLDLGIHESTREPTGTQFGPPGYRVAFRKNIVLNDNIDKNSENLQRYIMGKRTVEYLK